MKTKGIKKHTHASNKYTNDTILNGHKNTNIDIVYVTLVFAIMYVFIINEPFRGAIAQYLNVFGERLRDWF